MIDCGIRNMLGYSDGFVELSNELEILWKSYLDVWLPYNLTTTSLWKAAQRHANVPELLNGISFCNAYKQALVLKKRWQMIILFQHHSSMTDDDMAKIASYTTRQSEVDSQRVSIVANIGITRGLKRCETTFITLEPTSTELSVCFMRGVSYGCAITRFLSLDIKNILSNLDIKLNEWSLGSNDTSCCLVLLYICMQAQH